MKTRPLKLSDVITAAGTQIRAHIDGDTVDQYAEDMREAANKFPPIIVFHDGSQYLLADGFHRVMAASRNGFKDILAEVRKGTKADALKFALSANTSHGLRRTNADKHRSVELALAEWPKLSDREIARICAVSNNFASDVRKEQLSSNDSSVPESTRLGADGKERRLPKPKAILRPEREPEPDSAAASFCTPMNPDAPSESDRIEAITHSWHRWLNNWPVGDLPLVRKTVAELIQRA